MIFDIIPTDISRHVFPLEDPPISHPTGSEKSHHSIVPQNYNLLTKTVPCKSWIQPSKPKMGKVPESLKRLRRAFQHMKANGHEKRRGWLSSPFPLHITHKLGDKASQENFFKFWHGCLVYQETTLFLSSHSLILKPMIKFIRPFIGFQICEIFSKIMVSALRKCIPELRNNGILSICQPTQPWIIYLGVY